MVKILDENQLKRDLELACLINMSLDDIHKLPIATPESIRISDGKQPENLLDLYHDYKYLNFPAYLRTLMKTSATRRHPELFKLLRETVNKVCLDYGSGVGTHTIALLENNNLVTMLDIPGKLFDFAKQRVINREYEFWWKDANTHLPYGFFDVVICTDVLEHVEDPMNELIRIKNTLKHDGILHIQVSTMIKPSSGHFASSINKWKTAGPSYLKRYFIKEGATIWRKK